MTKCFKRKKNTQTKELSYKQDVPNIVFMRKLQWILQHGIKNLAQHEQHEPYYLKTGVNSRDTDNIWHKTQTTSGRRHRQHLAQDTDNIWHKTQNNDIQNQKKIIYNMKMH
jgi:hypothetical protein